MATTKAKYYTKMLETLVNYNDLNNAPFSKDKIWQVVSRFMSETEEEEGDTELNANNMTMRTLFNQSPVTNNTKVEIANVASVHFTISPPQG